MLIPEFEKLYCSHILKSIKEKTSLFEIHDFPYDEIQQGDDGQHVKVIRTENDELIPINEILTMDIKEFTKFYKTESAINAYQNYIKQFIIIEGKELMEAIQKEVKQNQERVQQFSSISLEDVL